MRTNLEKSAQLSSSARLGRIGPAPWIAAALLLVWELATRTMEIRPSSVPSPTRLLLEMWRESSLLARQGSITGLTALQGLAWALVTAFLIAGLTWASLSVRRVIAPLVSFFAKLPLLTLAPLAVVWIGFGSLPAVALTFFICVLPLITELQKGFSSVSEELFDTLEIMGATPAQVLWKVQIPAALPFLLRGLRLALPLALTGVVITEFVGADKGLGYVMLYASSRADPVQLFSALAVLMLMALFGYFVLFIAERLWVPWSDVVSVAKRDPQRM